MEQKARVFEDELSALKKKAPGLSQVVTLRTPSLPDLRKQLLPDEALMAIAGMQDGTGTLLITKNDVAFRLLPITADQTSDLVRQIRMSTRISPTGHVPPFNALAAYELYKQLLAWGAPRLPGVKQLTMVARGSLASIPFGLLVTHDPEGMSTRDMAWLIDKYAITHAPSITSWSLAGMDAGGARAGSFMAWADPDFGGEADREVAASSRSVRGTVRKDSAERWQRG